MFFWNSLDGGTRGNHGPGRQGPDKRSWQVFDGTEVFGNDTGRHRPCRRHDQIPVFQSSREYCWPRPGATRHPKSVSVSNAVHPAVYEIVFLGLFVSPPVPPGRLAFGVAKPNKKAEKPVKKGVFGLFRILFYKRRARGSNPQPHYWGTTFPVWPLTIRLPSVNTYPTLVCATQFRPSSPFAVAPQRALQKLGTDDSPTVASRPPF